MKTVAVVILLCIWVNSLQHSETLEKQALTLLQRTTVSELDPALPTVPLGSWFKELVGPRAGVNWQLSECGNSATTITSGDPDLPACMEANAMLPDGHKVVLAIMVGSFKKGLANKAAFNFGVVEYEEQLRPAKKLSDLPRLLSPPHQPTDKHLVELPEIKADLKPFKWLPQNYYPLLGPNKDRLMANLDVEPTPPEDIPPPPEPIQNASTSSQPQGIQQIAETVLQGSAITRVDAVYPPTARMLKAFGTVKVQITISETGRVIDARAISGHDALRSAAVEAARKWVFKPTTLNGAPIKVQGVLSVSFTKQ